MRRTWWVLAALVLLVLFVAVGFLSAQPNIGFKDAAAILAVISAGAVGIERLLEAAWTIVSDRKSAWWPMNIIQEQVKTFVEDANASVKPVFDAALAELEKAKAVGDKTDAEIAAIDAQKQQLSQRLLAYQNRTTELAKLAPDNQRVQLMTTSAWQAVAEVDALYSAAHGSVSNLVDVANQAITGANDFVAGFKDNPMRRLISLYVGTLIGMVLAAFVGLDVFAAVNETSGVGGWTFSLGGQAYTLLPFVGVAVTGIVMGLGASPTHEVIRVLQESKKKRKLGNDPSPDEGGTDGGTANITVQTGMDAVERRIGFGPGIANQPAAAGAAGTSVMVSTSVVRRRPSSLGLRR